LRALPVEEYERLEPHLEITSFASQECVAEPDRDIVSVCFPLDGVLLLVKSLGSGESVAVALVGRESFIGHAVVLGARRRYTEAIAATRSTCATMRADVFRALALGQKELHRLVLRSTVAMFEQVAQIAACNRVHPIDQRLARTLLLMHDRTGVDELAMTHEFLGEQLGVRRATITTTMTRFHRQALVRTTRGRVIIVHRGGLETLACECYPVLKEQYDTMFS
jgi:CRP-like cAMP-binding protein